MEASPVETRPEVPKTFLYYVWQVFFVLIYPSLAIFGALYASLVWVLSMFSRLIFWLISKFSKS